MSPCAIFSYYTDLHSGANYVANYIVGFNIIIIGKKISGLKMEISVLECISVRLNAPLRITQPQDFAPVNVRAQRTTFYHKLLVY